MNNDIIVYNINHIFLHYMPFFGVNQRKKNMDITKSWGDNSLNFKCKNYLNSYDLLTLIQIFNSREKNEMIEIENKDKFAFNKIETKNLKYLEIDILKSLKIRNINNQINNKNNLINSIKRLESLKISYKLRDETITTNIFTIKEINKKYIKIYIKNEYNHFLETYVNRVQVFNNNLKINFTRLLKYKRNNYCILLDCILQSTKNAIKTRNKTLYTYRKYFKHDFLAKQLNIQNFNESKQKKIIKDSFDLLKEQKLPSYEYNFVYENWQKIAK